MTSPRRSARLQLRRSISEQLRDSTSKAWDLLWRNVRERRLAGEGAKSAQKASLVSGTRIGITRNASADR
ncbi:unnamed protein product [Tetraodon nigroviridis]|uniref:(spotted green pufferfish) hypothetical protein n=1 Tax=Tetraodon nigroviridis TaxID=99883 RepID=Q4SG10_TETNG|nr:unnamed protein product [Tetraodon nigroviridis]